MKKAYRLIFVTLLICNRILAQTSFSSGEKSFNYEKEMGLADSFYTEGNTSAAIKKHYEILDYLEQHVEANKLYYKRLTDNYINVSDLHLFINDSISLLYANRAINCARKTGDYELYYHCFYLKFSSKSSTPNQESNLNDLADSCIKYANKTENNLILGGAYLNKSEAMLLFDSLQKAVQYAEKAEGFFKQLKKKEFRGPSFNNLGNLYANVGQYHKARKCHQICYEVAIILEDFEMLLDASYNLAEDYEQLGMHKESTKYFRIFSDSVVNWYENLLAGNFAEAEAKFNSEKKDREIIQQQLKLSEQETNKNRIIYLGIIIFLGLGGVFQWYLYSQRKKKHEVEQALKKEQELNEMRSVFLENVAHEIRTPITLINAYLDLALEENKDNTTLSKQLNRARSNSKKVIENADELLELMHLEKGSIPLKISSFVVDDFCKRVLFSFESFADVKKITLKYDSNLMPNFSLKSDKSRIEKIINNLVSNALKFSPSSSEIILKAREEENKLILTVSDQGLGIKLSEQKKIFDRFYQTSSGQQVGGYGVGLSLSKELAESLLGTLEVKSIEGKGASFSLSLNVNSFDVPRVLYESGKEDKEHNNPNFSKEAKMKILLVEDNPEMSSYLLELFSEHYDCDAAFNGQEALQYIQQKKYNLIMSDVMMPEMNGYELKEKMNTLVNYKNTPFIFLTAKTQLNDRLVGFRLGVDDYIAKPFHSMELLARTKALLANKKERDNWVKENLDFMEEGSSAEEKLLNQIKKVVLGQLSNENFKVTSLAEEVAYSQRQLTRFLRKTTGMSPVQYILELRLQKAYLCLSNKRFSTLAETRNYVGIPSSTHFNNKFLERFGIKPSEV